MNSRRPVALFTAAIVLVVLVSVGGWVYFHLSHPVSMATIEFNVAQAPADDTALKQWLAKQPVILKMSILRGANTLVVKYKLNNEKAMEYSNTVVSECRQLGYQVNGHSVSASTNPFLGTAFAPDIF